MTGWGEFYHPTGWGLIRIAALTVALLWFVGTVFPANDATGPHVPYAKEISVDPRLRPAIAPDNDARGVLDRIVLEESVSSKPSLAWIGGSSTIQCTDVKDKALRECQLLPSKVLDKISERCANASPAVDVYIKLGMRILDAYAFLQHAISKKPTVVVVTINPYWAFNDFSLIHRSDALSGVLHRGLEDETTVFWTALLGQPADFAFAGVARVLPVVRDRWDYHRQFFEYWQDRAPNIQGTLEQATLRKRQLRGQERKSKKKRIISNRTVRCAPHCIDTRNEGSGYRLIQRMFETIVDSGVSAIIYEAPFNQKALVDLARKNTNQDMTAEFAALFESQSAALREIAENFASPNITVLTAQDWSPQDLEFKDAIHLSKMGSLPDELSQELVPLVCDDSSMSKGAVQ